jgi:hypothetical protein
VGAGRQRARPGRRPDRRRDGRPRHWALYDAGQAVAALSVQATAEGLHVHQMGGFDADAARHAFDLDPDLTPLVVAAVGRLDPSAELPEPLAARERAPRSRLPLASLLLDGSDVSRARPAAERPLGPLARTPEQRGGQVVGGGAGGQRPGEEVALTGLAAQRLQPVPLDRGLDALAVVLRPSACPSSTTVRTSGASPAPSRTRRSGRS